jgi:site-specific recombinase XerD
MIKDFRIHDMPHIFASQLVLEGVDLAAVRDLLGHSSKQVMERYAHLAPVVTRRALDRLPAIC